MDRELLNRIIRTKLGDGPLPQNSIPRVRRGAGSSTGGAGILFHVMCFQIWDAERLAPGRT